MGGSSPQDNDIRDSTLIYMIRIGYKRCEYDYCVYVKSLDDGSSIFLLPYEDDMLIAAKRMSEVNKLKILLSKELI